MRSVPSYSGFQTRNCTDDASQASSRSGLDAEHIDASGADSERDDIMGEFFIAMRGAETSRLDRERFNHSYVIQHDAVSQLTIISGKSPILQDI